MKLSISFLLPLLSTSLPLVYSRNLLVSSYSGQITTLKFDAIHNSLTQVGSSMDASPRVGWIELYNSPCGRKYILAASSVNNGVDDKLSVLEVDAEGRVRLVGKTDPRATLLGPCAVVVHPQGMAVTASYGGSGINTFSLNQTNGLLPSATALQTFQYTLAAPGPVQARQDAPHPHHAILDPTKQFILVPDLGADLIRTYSLDGPNSRIIESTPVKVEAGAGPRHGVFAPSGEKYYQLNELSNEVHVFSVKYTTVNHTPTMQFTSVQNISTYPAGTTPAFSPLPTAAEIIISPDGRYLYTSNRSDKTFSSAAVGPAPNTQTVISDSITAFKISPGSGHLKLMEQTPVAGLIPRHFSMETTDGGRYVAVATQTTGRVAVYERDVHSGRLATVPVASIDVGAIGGAEPNCVIWLD